MPNNAQPTEESQTLVNTVHQELRASFLESMPVRLAEIQRRAEAIPLASRASQAIEALHAETHRLAGTSAVYGFLNTSTVARRFNTLLRESLESGNLALSMDIVRNFLDDLDTALQTDA